MTRMPDRRLEETLRVLDLRDATQDAGRAAAWLHDAIEARANGEYGSADAFQLQSDIWTGEAQPALERLGWGRR